MSLSDLQSRIAVIISADGQGAIREIQKVGQAADKDLGKATSNVDKLGNRLTYGGAAAMGFAAMAGGALYSFAKASDEAHQYELRLQNSMKNSPALANTNIESFKKLAQAIQGKTAADGDQVLGSMAVLAQFRLTETQIKSVTPLVVDYARKMGVDLETAAKNVGKAIDGKATALQKSGIKLDENVYKTDRLRAVMDGLRGTVGGFAEQEGQTFSGKLERFKNQMNDLKESIGSGVITTIGPLMDRLGGLAQAMGNVNEKTGGMVGSFATVSVGAIGALGALSFMTGQVIKLRQQMVLAEGGLSNFGLGVAGIGAVGLSFGIDAIFNKVAESTDHLSVNVQELQKQMSEFASNGALTGGYRRQIQDVQTLGHEIRMTGDASYSAAHSMSTNFISINGTIGNAIKVVKGYPSVWSEAVDNISKGNYKLFDAFGMFHASANESKKQIGALNQSLVALAQGGHADAAAKNFELLSQKAIAGGASQKDVNRAFREYLNVATSSSETIQKQTADYREFGGTVRFADLALSDQLELQNKLASGGRSLEESIIRLGDEERDYLKTLRDGTVDTDHKRLANLQLQDSIDGTVKKAEELAVANMKDADASVQAQAKQDAQKRVLDELRAKYPQLGPVIDEYVARLNAIPASKPTTVTVDTSQATRQLEQWRAWGLGVFRATFLGGSMPTAPHDATGGLVGPNHPYLIGERGPELFVPHTSGRIVPNNQIAMGGQSSSTYNVTVNVAAGAHPADVGAEVVNALKAYERRNGTGWRN